MDSQDRCLKDVNTDQEISCSVGRIPEVLIMEEKLLEDCKIMLIINTSERYFRYAECFSAEQAARLPEYKSWDHQIPLEDPNVKVRTGSIYKTNWEEDEALRKYLQENIPTGNV